MYTLKPAVPTLPLCVNVILKNVYEESTLVMAYINTQCPLRFVGFLLVKMLHNKPSGGILSLCVSEIKQK